MKKKLIMTKGLPASGKSTWACEQVKNLGFKRVNKDSLRKMIDAGVWSGKNEKAIVKARNALVETFLKAGHSVIVDDTNIAESHESTLRAIATMNKADFEIKDFTDVPLEVCLTRDRGRQDWVGEAVIRKMHKDLTGGADQPEVPLIPWSANKMDCIIVDIDGTIAKKVTRPWNDFDRVHEDEIKNQVLQVIDAVCRGGMHAFIFTGREDTGICRAETMRWLEEKVFPNFPHFHEAFRITGGEIKMRKEKDFRKDCIVKHEMFEEFIQDKFNVVTVFDDRDQVVEMWRENGLTCMQVAPGAF